MEGIGFFRGVLKNRFKPSFQISSPCSKRTKIAVDVMLRSGMLISGRRGERSDAIDETSVTTR
jgi:hypothetical protein